jgi:hypothetical protein
MSKQPRLSHVFLVCTFTKGKTDEWRIDVFRTQQGVDKYFSTLGPDQRITTQRVKIGE